MEDGVNRKTRRLKMKTQALILSFFLILTTASALAASPDAERDTYGDGLPSPYFVDDVHCQGNRVREVNEGWLLSKDEVEAARKVENQETCESLFRAFGIEKYMWLSPDDLERT